MSPHSGALVAFVADDEPLARQALRRALRADGSVLVAGEAEDLPSLRAMLRQSTPDVLFLDVAMPGGSGFDVLPHVGPATMLVFTTAYAEHAAAAFAVDAVDYLVKPFGHDRVAEALARVRRRRVAAAAGVRVPLRTVMVRVGPRLLPIPVDHIRRVEAADDCVRIVAADRTWLHGVTLHELEAQLEPSQFVRVHRQHLVNLDYVVAIEPYDARRLALVFDDGARVTCSRAGSTLIRLHARGGVSSR